MIKPTEVKYHVSTPFGKNVDAGEVINALLIIQDGNLGLIYHPAIRGECSSFEICKIGVDEVWRSEVFDTTGECYVNVIDKKFPRAFLGKNFKWKRKFFS